MHKGSIKVVVDVVVDWLVHTNNESIEKNNASDSLNCNMYKALFRCLFQFGMTQPFFPPSPARNFTFGAPLERLSFRC